MTSFAHGLGFSGFLSSTEREPAPRYVRRPALRAVFPEAQAPHEEVAEAIKAMKRALAGCDRRDCYESPTSSPMQVEAAPAGSQPNTPAVILACLAVRVATRTPEAFAEVAHYLDWRGRDWTPADRHKVVALLKQYPDEAAPAVLDEVERMPRADLLDAAVEVLRSLARKPTGASLLVEHLRARKHVEAREVCLRALGIAEGPQALTAFEAMQQALGDDNVHIREAAVWALVNLEAPGTREVLKDALERESDAQMRETLRDALDALP